MIVPMKKITIMVQAKDADSSVSNLRALGLLHVEHVQPPTGKDIGVLKEDISLISSGLNILSEQEFLKLAPKEQIRPADWKFVAKHIVDLSKRLEQLEEYARTLQARISEWERWGDFDPQEIEGLKQKNIFVRFYQVPRKQIPEIPSGVFVKEVFIQAGFVHCAIISQEKIDLPFKEIPLPKMGLEKMRQRLSEDKRMKNLIIDDIAKSLVHREPLIEIKKGLEKELEFQEAVQGMGKVGTVSYLTGYVPVDELEKVENAGRKERWGLLIQDPSDEDAPPVLLKNPRWIRLIEPVLKLLGIAPGYRETDVSPVFLIFFSIFFGILIGDAGYGLSYLLLALWFQKKKGTSQNANIFTLFYLLSACAIFWGILTGTFFGQDWLIARGIKPLVPALNEPVKMQTLCFFLGAIHLTIAHTWRAVIKFPHSTSLADVGWIAVLWVSYFLARTAGTCSVSSGISICRPSFRIASTCAGH